MSAGAEYSVIDGIKCYHPAVADSYSSYPSAGFDVTDELEDESFWVRARTRILRREVLRITAPLARAKMLEIGCGTGAFLRSLSIVPTLELVGSEIYLRGLQSAKANCPDVDFIQLDATAIPFEAEFDVVGAFDVIEHIDDDGAVLRGIHRALKPGGHLVLTVPQHPFMWSTLDEIVHHRRRYVRRDLLAKLTALDMEVVYVTSFVFCLFPLMVLSRLFDRKSAPKRDAAAFDKRVRFSPFANRLFDWIMRLDEAMIGRRLSLPWGGTLLLVARKRLPGRADARKASEAL